MNKVYTSPIKNYIQRNGFVMVSNLLIDYQQELGISEVELSFIIKIMKNKSGFAIHDKDLDPTVSQKTLSRRRNSLKQKGYLNFSVIKKQDPTTGTFATDGISYDLSPLEEKLQAISDRIEQQKSAEASKIIKNEGLVVESTEDDCPLEDYKREYEAYYGIPYVPSDYEIERYNELSDNDKKMVSYIFKYCEDNNLIGKIVPRLSLFFKTKFRYASLKSYCIENDFIEGTKKNDIEQAAEEEGSSFEQLDLSEFVKETYLQYYESLENLNYQFFKAVERIVYRFYDTNLKGLPKGVEKILDKAFDDNLKFDKNGGKNAK